MRRSTRRALGALALSGLITAIFSTGAGAVPPQEQSTEQVSVHGTDNRSGPLTARQDARHKAALEKVRAGEAAPNEDGVVQLADDKYAQVATTGTGQVFTILAEFGDQGSGRFGTTPARSTTRSSSRIAPSTTPRSGSRTSAPPTTRTSSSGRARAFKDFYETQSSGAYTVER